MSESEKAQVGLTFKTQLAAVDYLVSQGFKVGKSKFNNDVRAKKVAKNPEGAFDTNALLAYARVHLDPLAEAMDKAGNKATTIKVEADARFKDVQAKRMELKLLQEQGKVIERAAHERELAARAQFFKAEIVDFGLRIGAELIAFVDGDESKLGEFLEFWEDKTAEWMDAWSQDRDFGLADDDQDEVVLDDPDPEQQETDQ